MNKKGLTAKEKLFCAFYVSDGNAFESAKLAGYDEPRKNGVLLLMRDDINNHIDSLYKKKINTLNQKARFGYERLAFGNVTDAVKLLFTADPLSENLNQYDLFNVAEIKRPKEGAMEIKFFDRIKALEKLDCIQQSDQHGTSDFYKAIISGIKNLEESDGCDNL